MGDGENRIGKGSVSFITYVRMYFNALQMGMAVLVFFSCLVEIFQIFGLTIDYRVRSKKCNVDLSPFSHAQLGTGAPPLPQQTSHFDIHRGSSYALS